MLHRFYGGVRPAQRKGPTRRVAVVPLDPPPQRVYLPVGEGEGVQLFVQVGDRVAIGQMLSDGGPLGAAVHASVSGVVVALERREQSWGGKALCAVIENDGEERSLEKPEWRLAPRRDAPADLTPGEIAEVARLAGLVGEGGGMFPTDLKLQKAMGKTRLLIINGLECDSYLTADRRLMLERPREVVGGARLLMRALSAPRAVIAVAGSAYDAATALRNILPVRGGALRVKVIRTRYPQGAEEQLVQRLTGRRIPRGGGSVDVGCAVFNVGTAAALYDAVYDGKALTHRIVTVGGGAVLQPGNLRVPIGAPLCDLVNACGGWLSQPDRVLVGGGLTGRSQSDLTVPVLKGTAGILGLTRGEERGAGKREGACIHCGRCLEVCPMRLEPFLLRLYAGVEDVSALEKLHIKDCTLCGACAWACPGRVRLTEAIRKGMELMERPPEAEEPHGEEEEPPSEEEIPVPEDWEEILEEGPDEETWGSLPEELREEPDEEERGEGEP